MDLNNLVPVEKVIEIVHPGNGENIGVRVSLLSVSDEKLLKVRRLITDRNMKANRSGKKINSELVQENEFDIMKTAITGWDWHGDVTFNGSKPELNDRNLRAVFDKLPWFKAQIQNEMDDEESFFPN